VGCRKASQAVNVVLLSTIQKAFKEVSPVLVTVIFTHAQSRGFCGYRGWALSRCDGPAFFAHDICITFSAPTLPPHRSTYSQQINDLSWILGIKTVALKCVSPTWMVAHERGQIAKAVSI